jgi:hypothetical protein
MSTVFLTILTYLSIFSDSSRRTKIERSLVQYYDDNLSKIPLLTFVFKYPKFDYIHVFELKQQGGVLLKFLKLPQWQ